MGEKLFETIDETLAGVERGEEELVAEQLEMLVGVSPGHGATQRTTG